MITFFLYFAYVMVEQQKVIYSKEAEMASIGAKIKEEEKNMEELKKQKDIINSDEYIEKIAREKLGMVKKGEKIFVDVNK
jgi:cell division protein FtsB